MKINLPIESPYYILFPTVVDSSYAGISCLCLLCCGGEHRHREGQVVTLFGEKYFNLESTKPKYQPHLADLTPIHLHIKRY